MVDIFFIFVVVVFSENLLLQYMNSMNWMVRSLHCTCTCE